MNIYTSTQVRAKLFNLIDETNHTHEPIYIKGKLLILSKFKYNKKMKLTFLYFPLFKNIKKVLESEMRK